MRNELLGGRVEIQGTYGHSSLGELLLGVSTSSVGNVDGVSDLVGGKVGRRW